MNAPIIDLADAAAETVAEVGGKARQLSQLLAFGLKVPSGFVVRVSALAGDIDDRLRAAIADELTRRDWHTRALAVRSSAPQEDSAATSFAGIFRSELHVVGVEAVLAAIARVRASAQAPAANAYRARHGLPDAGMAILIMPMLPAVAAGVAFTCDPRSGRDDRIVIHAVSGLADALVGGQAIGEEIVIAEDRLDESLRFCTPRRNDGGRAPLPDEAALALGHVLRDAAQALDYAEPYYDLEWVFDGADCWLVQARPVTARPWHTYPGLAGQEAVWSNGNTRDVVPHVMGAMDWLGWRRMADLLLEQGYLLAGFPLLDGARRSALIGGRLYLNASFIQWEGYDALGVAPSAMNALLGGHHPEIAVPPPRLLDRLRRLSNMLRYLTRADRRRRQGRAQASAAQADSARGQIESPTAWSDAKLATALKKWFMHARTRDGMMFLQGSSGGNLYLLLELVGRHFPDEAHALVADLIAGGPPSATAQQALALGELARLAADDPAVRAFLQTPAPRSLDALPDTSAFRRAFEDFIRHYGHRGIYESYLASPRFAEAPDYLFDLIAAQIECPDDRHAEAREKRSETAWRRLGATLSPWRRAFARKLVATARVEANDRELARSALVSIGAATRKLLLVAGKRMVERTALAQRDDVFDLTPHELFAALDGTLAGPALKARVAHRRRQRNEWNATAAPEVFYGQRAQPPAAAVRSSSGAWRGVAVGGGVAEGVARVALTPQQGTALAAGDILVAPSTDPAWTPLFLRAGALVMETGGYLSHGAIVAREFGIPAVVNLPGILASIHEGQRLRVDGTRGEVTILD